MAERYDRNPHVAFVNVGHFGMWGEGHTVMSTPKHGRSWGLETQKKHIDLYCKHFKNTQLCISDDFAGHDAPGSRFPITDYAFSRGVTIRDDSILVQPPPHSWYHSEMAQLFWPTLPGNPRTRTLRRIERARQLGQKSAGQVRRGLPRLVHVDSLVAAHPARREPRRDRPDQPPDRLPPAGIRNIVARKRKNGRTVGNPFRMEQCGRSPLLPRRPPVFHVERRQRGNRIGAGGRRFRPALGFRVCEAGKTEERQIVSTFRIAPRYADKAGTFFRACKPGVYDLYVSAGMRDGTPVYELPYDGNDGRRRYKLGRITVSE